METIWEFLPKVIKHYNCRKIFSTKDSSNNLKKLLDCLQDHNITLIIVETVTDAAFGVFMAEKLKSLEELKGQSLCKSTVSNDFSPFPLASDPKLKHSFSNSALLGFKDMQHFGSS